MFGDRSRPGPGPAARPPASRVRGHAGPVGHRRARGASGGRRDPRGRARGAPLRGGLLQEGGGVPRCGAGAGRGGGRGSAGQQRGDCDGPKSTGRARREDREDVCSEHASTFLGESHAQARARAGIRRPQN